MSFLLGPFRRSPAKRTSVNSHPLSSPSASRSRISPGGYFTGVASPSRAQEGWCRWPRQDGLSGGKRWRAENRRPAARNAKLKIVEALFRSRQARARRACQDTPHGGPPGPGQARARTALVGGPGPTGPQRRDGAAKPCHNRPASRPERRAPGGRSAHNMFPPQLHAYLARGRAHREPPSRVHENRSAVCPRRPPSPRQTPPPNPRNTPPADPHHK